MKLQIPIIHQGDDSLWHLGLLSHIFDAEEAMTNVVRMTPEPINSLIAESEVVGARLASLLEAAVIDYEMDADGDIYASEGLDFPVWITVAEEKKLIAFFTFYDPESVGEQALQIVNELNQTIVVVQFSLQGRKLWGHYWITYDGALNVKHFVKMLRRFSGAFLAGVQKFKSSAETLPCDAD